MKSSVWLNNFMYTYFILRKNASVANVEKKLESLVVKYVGPEVEKFMGTPLKQLHDSGGQYGYYVTLVPDIRLHNKSVDGLEPVGNILYVYSFGVIAIFIMVIACINFMNMSRPVPPAAQKK